jgi:hypothetical protein
MRALLSVFIAFVALLFTVVPAQAAGHSGISPLDATVMVYEKVIPVELQANDPVVANALSQARALADQCKPLTPDERIALHQTTGYQQKYSAAVNELQMMEMHLQAIGRGDLVIASSHGAQALPDKPYVGEPTTTPKQKAPSSWLTVLATISFGLLLIVLSIGAFAPRIPRNS